MADTDPAVSALDGIRERVATLLPMYPDSHYMIDALVQDVSRLVAAVEAALKLADDLDAEAARLLATAARLRTGATGTQNRAWAHRDCAKALREAITAALTGKETGDA